VFQNFMGNPGNGAGYASLVQNCGLRFGHLFPPVEFRAKKYLSASRGKVGLWFFVSQQTSLATLADLSGSA
jgi:hypothetical protein